MKIGIYEVRLIVELKPEGEGQGRGMGATVEGRAWAKVVFPDATGGVERVREQAAQAGAKKAAKIGGVRFIITGVERRKTITA